MTTLGHIIVGTSIGVFGIPSLRFSWPMVAYVVTVIAMANVPDWPLPGWGHHNLTVSHSLFVNSVAITCITLALARFAGGATIRKHRSFFTCCIAAWLSHFLLDTLYADTGLAVLWPLSSIEVSLPIPWLRTMPHVPPPFNHQVRQILFMELLTFSPFLALAIGIRKQSDYSHKISPPAKHDDSNND